MPSLGSSCSLEVPRRKIIWSSSVLCSSRCGGAGSHIRLMHVLRQQRQQCVESVWWVLGFAGLSCFGLTSVA
jgi:hypothetical protein